jgi:deoxyribose-phosphate aldolase
MLLKPTLQSYATRHWIITFVQCVCPRIGCAKQVKLLKGSAVKIATVVGFPMGYSHTPAKIEECKRAVDEGAHEIDLVINIAALKEGDYNYLKNELTSVTAMIHLRGAKLKVILETGLLTDEEIIKGCDIMQRSRCRFCKNIHRLSMAKAPSVRVIELLRKNLPKSIKIKASGGIDSVKKKLLALIKAGADRIGSSKSVKIVSE